MSRYKDYNSDDSAREGEASKKRALLFSIKKWEAMCAVPAKELRDFYHSDCALCERYGGDDCRNCPLVLGKIGCGRLNSPWGYASSAYGWWRCRRSRANFILFRKAARVMLGALEDCYSKLYDKGA